MNKLKLNLDQIQLVVFGSKKQAKIASLKSLNFNGNVIQQQISVNFLGIILGNTLSYNDHINKIISKVSQLFGALRSVRLLLPLNLRKQLYQSLILPHLTDGICSWSATSEHNLKRMDVLTNGTCRHILLTTNTEMHKRDLYSKLDFLSFRQLVTFHNAINAFIFIYCGSNILQLYLHHRNNQIHNYPARHNGNFQLPHIHSLYTSKLPSYIFCKVCNSLPTPIKSLAKISLFKHATRKFMNESPQ